MSRKKPFVVRSPDGRMWLGGRRHDEGPWWRLQPGDAQRFRTRDEADVAARWSGGTVEER